MLIIAEAKLDNTYINSQFAVDNYHLWRADRNSRGGGLLVVFDSQSIVVLLFVSKYESVKFGRIQFLQNQLSVDIERLLYSLTVISMHFI
jgi:hypothetical protein